MAFKMDSPICTCNTPIYERDLEPGVMGEANNNGSILINKNMSQLDKQKAISHEKVHLDQIERGDLNYDNNNVYWKGKKYSRASMIEGAKNLPWEKEAYSKG
tara:strand:+ start:2781 stop:3086 length:306 start_codon:yes stop_codon:yes gene_type:complete